MMVATRAAVLVVRSAVKRVAKTGENTVASLVASWADKKAALMVVKTVVDSAARTVAMRAVS